MSEQHPPNPRKTPFGAATSGRGFRPEPAGDVEPTDPTVHLGAGLCELEAHERLLLGAQSDRNRPVDRGRALGRLDCRLDEFFATRVAWLARWAAADDPARFPDGRSPTEALSAVRPKASRLAADRDRCYREAVRPALADAGVLICSPAELSADDRSRLRDYVRTTLRPASTPVALSADPPFVPGTPLSNAVAVETADGSRYRLSVPSGFVRADDPGAGLADLPPTVTLVPRSALVLDALDVLLPTATVEATARFRVTRARPSETTGRPTVGPPTRLELGAGAPESLSDRIVDALPVPPDAVHEVAPPLDLRALTALEDTEDRDRSTRPVPSRPHPRLGATDSPVVFDELREADALLNHPYHGVEATFGRLLSAAVADDDVVSVRAVLDGAAVEAGAVDPLVAAAEAGRRVVAVTAPATAAVGASRAGIARAERRLEAAGVRVVRETGTDVGARAAVVVREEATDTHLYSYLGPGTTAAGAPERAADVALLTADRAVGRDLVQLCNRFTGQPDDGDYRQLAVGPGLREPLRTLVERETAAARRDEAARIVAKLNVVSDPDLVEAFYRASAAGVEIDLVVSDVCTLRPQVKGLSDSIRVHSVGGRLRDRSRLFWFHGGGTPDYYLGSCDWSPSALDRRVELLVPVGGSGPRTEIDAILEAMLADTSQRWMLRPDGSYERVQPNAGTPARSAHGRLAARAVPPNADGSD